VNKQREGVLNFPSRGKAVFANHNPELAITHNLFLDINKKTATFGTIDDMNLVEHIGVIKG
jgi:hypothetical protein